MAPRGPRPAKSGLKIPLWLVLLVVLLLVVPLVWMLVPRATPMREALYDPYADRPITIPYANRDWVPTAEPVALRDETMRVLGDAGGYTLYAQERPGGGGGAADPALPTDSWQPSPEDRIYLKVGEDRYVPLRWKTSETRP